MSSQQPTQAGAGITAQADLDASSLLARFVAIAKPNAGKAASFGPGITNSLIAVLAALRWGAVMIGLAWAANRAAQGNIQVVVTLSVAIFITSWRTIAPIRFGEPGPLPLLKALGDVAGLALAIGVSDLGLGSAFIGSLFVAIAVVGFGWGTGAGLAATLVAVVLSIISGVTFTDAGLPWTDGGIPLPGPVAVTGLVGVALVPGFIRERLVDIEERRRNLMDQRDKLAETNELLELLSDLARTLPSSLDLNDVLAATKEQLIETFHANRIAIISYEEGDWSPQLQDGFNIPPQVSSADLPSPLNIAADSSELLRVPDLSIDHDRPGSGLYTRLVVAGVDIGLLAIEHNGEEGQYQDTDAELLRGMSDVLALTLANARSFRRLRSLAAAEERSRIARDLHDRLGQYLTYIALELERINSSRDEPSVELKQLHEDVQGAISEFRDTLIELRAAVTTDRPLSVVLREVIERFRKRASAEVKLDLPEVPDRLPAIVENELLRIAQEALVNVEKHSSATEVHVAWSVSDGRGVLVVQDDGRGFDPSKGIRGSAYGLVGMRERAASVGAMLEISSEPGQGTVITVQTSEKSEQVKKP